MLAVVLATSLYPHKNLPSLARTPSTAGARDSAPDEQEQFEAYQQVLLAAGDKPIIFRTMDIEQPVFEEGRVRVHPKMKELWPQMVELGITSATRPEEVGGASLPLTVASLAYAYLMAGNLGAYALGTVTSMVVFASTLGFLAAKAGEAGARWIRTLMSASSAAAILVGAYWIATSFAHTPA